MPFVQRLILSLPFALGEEDALLQATSFQLKTKGKGGLYSLQLKTKGGLYSPLQLKTKGGLSSFQLKTKGGLSSVQLKTTGKEAFSKGEAHLHSKGCQPYYCIHPDEFGTDHHGHFSFNGWQPAPTSQMRLVDQTLEFTTNTMCADACDRIADCNIWVWHHSPGGCELYEATSHDLLVLCPETDVDTGPDGKNLMNDEIVQHMWDIAHDPQKQQAMQQELSAQLNNCAYIAACVAMCEDLNDDSAECHAYCEEDYSAECRELQQVGMNITFTTCDNAAS